MHLEIALSLSLCICLPRSLPLFHILPLSLFFSLSWLFWLVNYFIQHICWIDAWIIHQLHVATIISCYFYLPGLLCSAKQFKVLLARFLLQSGRGGFKSLAAWVRKRGKNKYKPITILTIAYIRRNRNEAVYQTDCLCCNREPQRHRLNSGVLKT